MGNPEATKEEQEIAIVEDPTSADYKRALSNDYDALDLKKEFGRYSAEEFKANSIPSTDGTKTGCAACLRGTSASPTGSTFISYVSMGVEHRHVYAPAYVRGGTDAPDHS